MALGDRHRAEAIRATRQEAGQEVANRTVIQHTRQRKNQFQKKKRYNFAMTPDEREKLSELTDLFNEKSDSAVVVELITRAYKAATATDFNREQTDIFDFL